MYAFAKKINKCRQRENGYVQNKRTKIRVFFIIILHYILSQKCALKSFCSFSATVYTYTRFFANFRQKWL